MASYCDDQFESVLYHFVRSGRGKGETRRPVDGVTTTKRQPQKPGPSARREPAEEPGSAPSFGPGSVPSGDAKRRRAKIATNMERADKLVCFNSCYFVLRSAVLRLGGGLENHGRSDNLLFTSWACDFLFVTVSDGLSFCAPA